MKNHTEAIEQVKEDLAEIEVTLCVARAVLVEAQKHKETLEYFLETIL